MWILDKTARSVLYGHESTLTTKATTVFLHTSETKPILLKAFLKRHVLDSSKTKDFADGNSKFGEDGRKFSKRVENIVGKIARYEQFLLFPQCFQKDFIADT